MLILTVWRSDGILLNGLFFLKKKSADKKREKFTGGSRLVNYHDYQVKKAIPV